MRIRFLLAGIALLWGSQVHATVYINEVFINPPGSLDVTREFIELAGTPGRKLDGYAVAFLAGAQEKYYPLDSIPPYPVPSPEIDEFFSLDGLALGRNGLLVLTISNKGNYPEVLADSAFRGNWASIWNGGADEPGKLQNDGSITVLLVRNRPGRTEQNPAHSLELKWGKSILMDAQLERPVLDPQDDVLKDQWGDGDLDVGEANGLGGYTLDMVGALTAGDFTDDLEVVDEVSYEHGRGWEYDTDDRRVDEGSPHGGLPERRVHALDDPQGFNPDALARVDYRTTGPGWAPTPGAIGSMFNGNNWQDTATEQWVRGEATLVIGSQGPEFFFDHSPNSNEDSVQPYTTNVPSWLDDGYDVDYDFSEPATYRITPGRMNPLSIPYVPGDVDRDGDCDGNDLAKMLSVFGDDDWIFSNAFDESGEGNDGDPGQQVRPWDVDCTGSEGIECSDLQWVLNFQNCPDGRIEGVMYDDETPADSGVRLNSNASVECEVTVTINVLSGRPLDGLAVGDVLEIDVAVEVVAGFDQTAGSENGVMQFAHDLQASVANIVHVESVEPLGAFTIGRPALLTLQGPDGSLGISNIHGYTTSFTEGLATAAVAYRVRMQANEVGAVELSIAPAAAQKFAESTPYGLKVGHTDQHGDPFNALYPDPVAIAVTDVPFVVGDCDGSGDVTVDDAACFIDCLDEPDVPASVECARADVDGDADVDLSDWAEFELLLDNRTSRDPS